MKTIVLCAWCLFFVTTGLNRQAFAQPGTLDMSFDPGAGFNNPVYTTAFQSDGKVIVGGPFTFFNGAGINRIARLTALGSLDVSFNPGTGFNNYVGSTALQPDGKIFVGGAFSTFNGVGRNAIVRLNSNGSLDASFNPGTGFNSSVETITLQPDGKIIVGGSFTTFNGTGRNRIARLNSDGSLDASFNPGTGLNDGVTSIVLQTDGKIIIGGDFTTFNGTGRNRIARLNADGSLDAAFNPGTGLNGTVHSTTLQPDEKILVGGAFSTFNGVGRNAIVRLNSNGSLDANFNPDTGFNNIVYSTALQPDGKILIAGSFTTFNGTGRNRIARLNEDGSLDATFNPGTGFNNIVYSTALQPDGNIILAGSFTTFNGTSRNYIARLSAFDACVTVEGIDEIFSCEPITWIDGNTYSTSNNTATHLLAGAAQNGCDSLVTLNLTLTPCTQLQTASCGISNLSVNTTVFADIISGALGYRFRIVGNNNGAAGWSGNTFVLDRTVRNFKFNMAPGVIWGQTYTVDVAVTMDGVNYGAYGNACSVTLENIPTTQLEAVHCGSTNVAFSTRIKANNVTSAAGYRFRITGNNSGGAGWSGNVFVLNRPNREFRFNMISGILLGETYQVEVAVLSQNGVDYGSYGPPCNVTLASPTITLEPASCGATNVNMNTKHWAVSVVGAVAYRFRIVGTNNGAAGWNGNEFIIQGISREFRFIEVPGVIWGQTYAVQAASSLDGANFTAYGAVCNVTLENIPTTTLEPAFCGVTNIGINTKVRAISVPAAAGYRFRIVGNNTGAAGWVGNTFILDRPNRELRFVLVPGAIAGQTYSVEVAVLAQDGITYGTYGAACDVTLSNMLAPGINPDDDIDEAFFEVAASHNPFTTDFGLQVLTAQDYEPITIAIYDMSGKLINRQTVYPLDIDVVRFGSNLASGMYMIEVRQGSNQAVIRQVKN